MNHSINDNILCSYGCGNFANFITKHGKPCCSETFYKCPGYRKRQSNDAKNRPPSIPKGTILKPKTYHPGKCEVCGKDHDGAYGSGRFCSQTCARKASSLLCDKKAAAKKASQTLKSKSPEEVYKSYLKGVETYNRNHPDNPKVISEFGTVSLLSKHKNNTKSTSCKICGQIECLQPEKCSHMRRIKISKFASIMDLTKLGTIDIYQEYDKLYRFIYDLYINKQQSSPQISKILNVNWITVMLLVQRFGIEKRSRSESSITTLIHHPDKFKNCGHNNYYCGYHTSWEGKKFWYRSSYELDYAKELDEKKIRYEVESIRLPYYSKLKGRMAFMITDFYLPDNNTVVEIKGDFTYVKEDISERFSFLKEKGYNCKLILEKVEFNSDNLPNTKLQRNITNL